MDPRRALSFGAAADVYALARPSASRVLRPGGTLGLLWNVLDDSSGWPREVADVVGMEDRLSYVSEDQTRPYAEPDGLEPWSRGLFRHSQPADADLVVANMASRSVVIMRPPEERLELLGRVRTAVPEEEFTVPWVCDAWRSAKPH